MGFNYPSVKYVLNVDTGCKAYKNCEYCVEDPNCGWCHSNPLNSSEGYCWRNF